MLLCNKAETGWAAPSDVQKARLCLLPIAPCKAFGKTTLTKCTKSNSSHRLSSKPLSSFANSGTWCSTLQVAIMWQVSGTAGRGRRTATYLGGWAAAGKDTWQHEKVWENLTKLSGEITPDSLRGISVTNKTGQSYYALLWVTHSCYILYANSDVCWIALWADSLHLPGKNSHTANLSSKEPISTGDPRVTILAIQQGAWGRLCCPNITQPLWGTLWHSNEHDNSSVSGRNITMPIKKSEMSLQFTLSQTELTLQVTWSFWPKKVCLFGFQKLEFIQGSTQQHHQSTSSADKLHLAQTAISHSQVFFYSSQLC